MKAFLANRKRKSDGSPTPSLHTPPTCNNDDDSTELKLAMLSSLHPEMSQEALLDVLLAHEGSVTNASASLEARQPLSPVKRPGGGVIGHQQSLRHFTTRDDQESPVSKKLKSKKGSTLHLYDPADVAEHTPCTIIHNFLPADVANDLLKEMLFEAESFERNTFKLFDNVVSSPHTSGFFVESYDDIRKQKTEYLYNGSSPCTRGLGTGAPCCTTRFPFRCWTLKQKDLFPSIASIPSCSCSPIGPIPSRLRWMFFSVPINDARIRLQLESYAFAI